MSERKTRRRPHPKKASLATTAVVIVLVLGYIALRPVIESRFGVLLPSITENAESPVQPQQDGSPGNTAPPRQTASGGLRDVGGGVKESPAGLRYGPGSLEGDRWKHVLRHTRDYPDRPVHGVFDVDGQQLVAVIDEAYEKAQERGSQVRKERDGPRTIYTVDMQRRIGFIGGQSGRRQRHPPANGLRLILEGRNVITAYPVKR